MAGDAALRWTVCRAHPAPDRRPWQPPQVLGKVEEELADRLTVTATITSVSLFVSDGQSWRPHTEFPMLSASSDA
jgi:hypothetical protein